MTLPHGGLLAPLFRSAKPTTELNRTSAVTSFSGRLAGFVSANRPAREFDRRESEMSVEPMKRLFIACMLLGCLSFSFAQGLQGNVKLSGNTTVAVTGHSVTLTWSASQNATSYNIYRGTTSGGPFTRLASGIVSTTYTDVQVTHNQTLYYVITAVNGDNESAYSNQIVAVIP